MEYHPLILIVEDDRPIRRFISTGLRSEGYRVVEAETAASGLSLAASHAPDVIILDLGLPDRDGAELIGEIRSWSQTPIIIVSARGNERSKVQALDAGADDYLTKPFGAGELLARVRVALRHMARRSEDAAQDGEFSAGDLRINLVDRTVAVAGGLVHLTPTEYRIVATLVKHAGRVVTHTALLDEVWGPGRAQETQYLRVFVANLRKKLEPNPARPRYLITEAGVGYRLIEE